MTPLIQASGTASNIHAQAVAVRHVHCQVNLGLGHRSPSLVEKKVEKRKISPRR